MKLEVNQDVCIGCGACQAICPDVFEINDEGFAEAKDVAEELYQSEDAIDAKEGCPVAAIEEAKAEEPAVEE